MDFHRIVKKCMRKYSIPNLGVVLISSDVNEINCYNLPDYEKTTSKTRWQIASLSKNISATCLCDILQFNEDLLELKPKDYFPEAKFSDDIVTDNANVADCMSHTTGIEVEAGSELIDRGYNREEAYKTFRFYPLRGFRSTFNYCDLVFTLGFETVCSSLGKTMDQQLMEFFKKYNLKSTNFNTDNIIPQYDIEGNVYTQTESVKEFIPAGGIVTTLKDLKTLIYIHLNQTISTLDVMYEPIIKSGDSIYSPNGEHYGIGTAIVQLKNNVVLFHAGFFETGIATIILYDVENRIGVGILSNKVNPIIQGLAYYYYLKLLGKCEETCIRYYTKTVEYQQKILDEISCPVPNCDMIDSCNKIFYGKYYNDTYGWLLIGSNSVTIGQ